MNIPFYNFFIKNKKIPVYIKYWVFKQINKVINLFDINNLTIRNGSVLKTITNNVLNLTATGTTGAQFVGEIIENLNDTKSYKFSCKAKKIVCSPDGDPRIRVYLAGSNDGVTYARIAFIDKTNPEVDIEYLLEYTFTGYKYCRIYLYNRLDSTVVVGEETEYKDIQLIEV